MHGAKVMAVLSGVVLLLSTSASMNTPAAGQQPASLSLEMEGCTNSVSCAAELFIGDMMTFTGSLETEDGAPISGADVKIIKMLPTPELVEIASGMTEADGSYSIEWTVEFTAVKKVPQDVTQKLLQENVLFFSQFEGDDSYSESRAAKLTATIKANEVTTSIAAEKNLYAEGESALIFIAFIDSNDEFVDPDWLRVVYDDQDMEVERKKTGSYTLMTPQLSIDHHQVIVISNKEGYNAENGYLTVQVQGTEDLPRSIVKRDR